MKRLLMRKGAMVGALAALLPAAITYAQPCGGNFSNPACAEEACQVAIQGAVATYLTSVGKNVGNMTSTSMAGKNSAGQTYACVSGVNINKACLGNNGACKTGFIGAPCNVDADCGAGGSCDLTKGCGTLDSDECQPLQIKSPFSKDIAKAQAALLKTITTKCGGVDLKTGLGIDKACPAVGTASGTPAQISALVDCIQQSGDGDFNSGNVIDAALRLYEKVTGSGILAPQSKSGPADLLPRQVLTMTGAQVLQIGAGNDGNNGNSPSAGGTVTTMALASCTAGNGKVACLNNADCKSSTNAGTCTRHALAADGMHTPGNAAAPVHKCCSTSAAANIGASCNTDADCGGTALACGLNSNCDGNVLTISETASNGLTTCLVTHTRNASACVGGSNGGLPCAGPSDCPGGACTNNDTSSAGAIDLLHGDASTAAPIATDVVVSACPRCVSGACSAGPNSGKVCNSAGGIDQACPPDLGTKVATVPNPFVLSTKGKSMIATTVASNSCGFCDIGAPNGTCDNPPCPTCVSTCPAGRTCDTTSGLPHKAFCGFCLVDNTIGCRSAADCPSGACSFVGVTSGFHGDCSVTEVDASSARPGQYLAAQTGLFCTGKTGVSLVDNTAGLPGPVRVNEPVINAYVYSKDH